MNDRFRFRFRVWDKEINAYLKPVRRELEGVEHDVFITPDGAAFSDLQYCINRPDGFIVEQCTGLKDKNGRLIYEGDIVRVTGDCMTIPPYLESKLAKVVWEINCFCFNFPHEDESYFSECWDYEVIGNIHENADLLEA